MSEPKLPPVADFLAAVAMSRASWIHRPEAQRIIDGLALFGIRQPPIPKTEAVALPTE